LLGIGGAALISKSFENHDRVATALDGPPFDHVLDVGNTYGDGLTAGIGVLGLLAVGKLSGNEHLMTAGGDLTESLLLTWGSVWAIKVLVHADRPNGGKYSFPSGHTATAFAIAPVLTKHFGWKVGVPAYTLATAAGLARMEDGQHYLADVLFGAAVGLVMGSEVTSKSCLCVVKEHIAVKGRGLGVKFSF
jgi:membrane-associated phospholipid phosphatase